MVVLKALSLALVGLLSLLAMGFMLREMQAVKVKARARQPGPQRLRRLRQEGFGGRCVFLRDGPRPACAVYAARPQQCPSSVQALSRALLLNRD